MSAAALFDCPCPTPVATQVPGSAGLDGDPGLNAFTTVASDFIVPAIGANVTVLVGTSLWMAVGQNVFVQGGGTFQVVSKTSIGSFIGTYLNYSTNTETGNVVVAGAGVSPGGIEPPLVPIGVVDPEGVVSGPAGSWYFNSVAASMWFKTSGSGTVGWIQTN